jgi:two-component system NtrC family response regulator
MIIDTNVARLAPSRATILIEGGSERSRAALARLLHDRSPRNAEAFATIDCASVDHRDLHRLLGDAVSRREIRSAGLGTLYVANVEQMPLCVQPLFLGFLDRDQRPRVVVSAGIDLMEATRQACFHATLSERLLLVRLALE